MNELSRREFLAALGALPFLRVQMPQLVMPPRAPAGQSNANLPNIILLVYDTFSAPHMSLLGYRRETTPLIDRLAERATVFHHHYAGGNFTSPGTASLLTGLYPWYHRSLQNYSHVLQSVSPNNLFNLLPDAYHKVAYTHNSLASTVLHQFARDISEIKPRRDLALADGLISDVLFPNDMPVAVHTERLFQGQSRNAPSVLAAANKIYRTYMRGRVNSQYHDLFPRGVPGGDVNSLYAFYILDNVTDWIHEQATNRPNPYALYVHLLPPHGPYRTRHDFIDVFDDGWGPAPKPASPFTNGTAQEVIDHQRRMYDEFVAYVDAEVARLFDLLEKSGALENTYVILTSDHGELFERGIVGHTTTCLNDPVLHIPLMIWGPGQTERIDVYERTSAVDVLPTLLHLTGQPIPDICEGAVLPAFGGDAAEFAERPVFALEAKTNNKFAPLTEAAFAFYQGPYKLLHYRGFDKTFDSGSHFELYDLENDPEELVDLYSTERGTAEAMRMQLEEKINEVNRPFQRG